MRIPVRLALVLALFASLLHAQEITPAENLVTDNVPKIPAALAEAADRYTNSRYADLASWNPTKREMLILTRFQDTNQVHYVKMPGGARTQLTFFPDGIDDAKFPPDNANYFVFQKDIGGGEFYQFYRYDMDSGTITLLTDGKSRNTGFVWANGAERIAYGSTRRTGKDVDIWMMDPRDPKTDHMVAQMEGGGWQVIDWSPDDRQLLVGEEVSVNESYLWLLNVADGTKTLLTPKGGAVKVAYSDARFAKDGKGLYVVTDKDSEFQHLAWLDLATKQLSPFGSPISWDVEFITLSRDGKKLAYAVNQEGLTILHLLNTATKKELPVPQLPAGVINGVRWHPNSREIGFNVISAHYPSDVYSLDTATGKVERWTYSETGGLNAATFSEPELVRWKSFDGKMISGFLYKPAAKFSGKRPVIINIHGGPEGQFRPGYLGRANYYLNELGIAILFPNVRGSSGFGKTFLTLDNGFLREDSYKDIRSLLDWIPSRPDLDANKVLITGGSYGGFMTLAVATNYNDLICCSVDVVGISNFVTFLQNTSGYRQDLRRVEYGDERDPKMREFLERISPMNKAQNVTKPLFVVQGKNDPRVPATESQQMVATVRKNGTPVWFLMANDEGHGFAKKKNQDFQFYATVMFVKKYLLGE